MRGNCDYDNVKYDINKKYINSEKSDRKKSKKKNNVMKRKRYDSDKDIIIYGSDQCGFCKNAYKKLKERGYNIDKRYFSTIKKAINEANKYSYGKIETIPAVFKKDPK